MNEPHVIPEIARYAVSVEAASIPDAVREKLSLIIMDTLGAAIAGADRTPARLTRDNALYLHREGQAPIWTTSKSLNPVGAAFANAAAATVLDADDGHERSFGHPSASLIPAIFAMAADRDASAEDITAALVVGYELVVRCGDAMNKALLPVTGHWVAIPTAAALARLLKMDEAAAVSSIALAAFMRPNGVNYGRTREFHSFTKEGLAFGAAAAVEAALLAEAGYTAPRDAMDDPDAWTAHNLLHDLGDTFETLAVYMKPFASCRWTHAPLEAALNAFAKGEQSADAIEAIDIQSYEAAVVMKNEVPPQTDASYQYSIPFLIATALADGRDALLPYDLANKDRPELAQLARKVRIRLDEAKSETYYNAFGAQATVHWSDGSSTRADVDYAFGGQQRPAGRADYEAKFRTLTRGRIETDRQNAIIAGASDLTAGIDNRLVRSHL